MSDLLLPPLPQLEVADIDLMLDVYTHHTLHLPGQPMKNGYGDTSRLRDLGKKTLELIITYILFSQHTPMKGVEEIQRERNATLAPQNIEKWVNSYGLKSKLRIAPNEVLNVINNANEMADFFYVYVGALYIRKGLAIIQNWISRLVIPGGPVVPLPATPAFDGAYNPQTNQYMQQPAQGVHQSPFDQPNHLSSTVAHSSQFFGAYIHPLPSKNSPHLPSISSSYNNGKHISSPPGLSLVTLGLVNQTAGQKRISVTYLAGQQGPSHQTTWTVKCCMDGVEKGIGIGKSQKMAKEDAARQAWVAMGWGLT